MSIIKCALSQKKNTHTSLHKWFKRARYAARIHTTTNLRISALFFWFCFVFRHRSTKVTPPKPAPRPRIPSGAKSMRHAVTAMQRHVLRSTDTLSACTNTQSEILFTHNPLHQNARTLLLPPKPSSPSNVINAQKQKKTGARTLQRLCHAILQPQTAEKAHANKTNSSPTKNIMCTIFRPCSTPLSPGSAS